MARVHERLTALSRITSRALRHEPARFGLALDSDGWVGINEFIAALGRADPRWQALAAADLHAMIAASAKTRHQIDNDRIRAIYGHSVPGRLSHEPASPPPILFHGTSLQAAELILREGLKPMSRQYVHLSPTRDAAREVGRRKAKVPSLLTVAAADAFAAGIPFYRGNDLIWLADAVPPSFIQRDEPGRP